MRMTAKQLIAKLQKLPNLNLPVWLGADTGEGWIPLMDVFEFNAIDAPLDGDSVSEYEHEYVKKNKYKPAKGDVVEDTEPDDSEISVYRPVIILGDDDSKQQCKEYKYKRENRKQIEEKNRQARVNQLKLELARLENKPVDKDLDFV